MQAYKKEKSEKAEAKQNELIGKASKMIATGKQIPGSTTGDLKQDLPPPPGDVATTDAKATKHELEVEEKKAPIPGNKLDAAKEDVRAVNVEHRPTMEVAKATVDVSKWGFAPKNKDVPINYPGAGVKPFALAQVEAFKPRKHKGHHSKHHTSEWDDEIQPGPMELPKDAKDADEEPAPADDDKQPALAAKPVIVDGMDEADKEEARLEAQEEQERKEEEKMQEEIRKQEAEEERRM